jgi:hypothetical protein
MVTVLRNHCAVLETVLNQSCFPLANCTQCKLISKISDLKSFLSLAKVRLSIPVLEEVLNAVPTAELVTKIYLTYLL